MQTRWPTVKRERWLVEFVFLFLMCWGLTIVFASVSDLAFTDPIGAFLLCAVCAAVLLVAVFVYLRWYVFTSEKERLRAEVTALVVVAIFFGAGMITIHMSLPYPLSSFREASCMHRNTPETRCVYARHADTCMCDGRVIEPENYGATGRVAHLDGPGQCTPSQERCSLLAGPKGETGPQGRTLPSYMFSQLRIVEKRYDDVILKATDKVVEREAPLEKKDEL